MTRSLKMSKYLPLLNKPDCYLYVGEGERFMCVFMVNYMYTGWLN